MRAALLRDQWHLCAYCQRRIPVLAVAEPRMRIEHWDAQSEGGAQLTWSNLLGVCPGDIDHEMGERRGPTPVQDRLHCDNSRGNRALFLNPVEGRGPDPREHLRYTGSGEVRSQDDRAHADLTALNLNAPHLRRGRAQALEALRTRLDRAGWTRRTLCRALDQLAQGAKAPEHVEVARYQLERWLRKRQS